MTNIKSIIGVRITLTKSCRREAERPAREQGRVVTTTWTKAENGKASEYANQ